MKKAKGPQKATLQNQPLLCAEVDGKRTAPEWIPLLPAGDVVLARDGRHFRNDHSRVLEAFKAGGMDLPIDWDHALDSWGVAPGDSRAAAWVDQLEVREGALWGHVSIWTAKGRESIESCEYRYISPVIYFDDDRKVVHLPRASLVNNPALRLPALCTEENENSMNEHLIKLLAGLELSPDTCSEETIAAALETFARGKAPALAPDLTSHVPKEQYEAVVSELAGVKTQLATLSEQAQAAKVEQVIKEALSSGRLLPSERDFFTKQAAKDVAEVEKFLASRAPMGQSSAKQPAITNPSDPASLTDEEKAVAKAGGISLNAFAAAKAARTQKV
jgi:phage I-like protein